MIYSDFISFMQSVVIPSKIARPDDIRLDGQRTGGNMEVAGRFEHQDKKWKVHADTHYEPLDLALAAAITGRDPFVEADTPKGKYLELVEDIKALHRATYKHLYIYED